MGRRKREPVPVSDTWWNAFTTADFEEAFAARRKLLLQIGESAATAICRDPVDPKHLAIAVYSSKTPVPTHMDGYVIVNHSPPGGTL